MKILYIAEIVSKPGLWVVKNELARLKKEHAIDFVLAGADAVTSGYGMGQRHFVYLRKLGVDVTILGDFAFFKRDLVQVMDQYSTLLRPANLVQAAPGRGWYILRKGDLSLAIISLLGQTGSGLRIVANSPFTALDGLIERIAQRGVKAIFVDFHATTTAEKQAFMYYAQDRVSAVIGSHMRVMTHDARLLGHTAVVTDAGRTGSAWSVGGFNAQKALEQYFTGIPHLSEDSWERLEFQGLVLTLDDHTGYAESIVPLRFEVPLSQKEEVGNA